MLQFRVSPQAEADIENILEWTEEHFGEAARLNILSWIRRSRGLNL
jgi:plasmid stabilization system protein ParE